MKSRPVAFIVFLFLFTQTARSQNHFRIAGTLSKDTSIMLHLLVNGDALHANVSGTHFLFEGSLNKSAFVSLTMDYSCGLNFYIEPTEMTLSIGFRGEKNNCPLSMGLHGSTTQDQWLQFNKELMEIPNSYSDKGQKKVKELTSGYVSKNAGSEFAADLVLRFSRSLGYNWTNDNYNMLSDDLKQSKKGQRIHELMGSFGSTKIGSYVFDFSQKDRFDSTFNLSSLRGKYVLIDFWASWCGPCRKENPNVKKVYEKYHANGFEVVGVSLDNDGKKWKDAIEKDGLPWIHISDLKGWDNELAVYFHVNGIPTNILIDTEGKIIATDLRGSALERKIARLF
jgi:thiol-disulfide isomerase/thioredoxin